MKIARATLGATAFAIWSASAHAVNPELCSAAQPTECLDGVSASATSLATLRISLAKQPEARDEEKKKQKQARFQPIAVASAEKVSALLSEDASSGWAAWASYGKSSYGSRSSVTPSNATLHSLRLGADRLLRGRYSLGAAVAAERLDVTTRFNGGAEDGDSIMLIPYFTILASDALSVDFNAGLGNVSERQNRIDPVSVPGAPAILTSSYDARRRFHSVTVNGMREIGNWVLGGRIGYIDSRENQDGYTERGGPSARTVRDRAVKLRQVLLGADAAYRLRGNFEVYGSGLHRRDITLDDGGGAGLPAAPGGSGPGDRTQWDWTLGLRFYGSRGMTLAAEWMKTTGRELFVHRTVNLLARFDY